MDPAISSEPLTDSEFAKVKHKVEKFVHRNNVQESLDIPYIPRFILPAFMVFRRMVHDVFKERDLAAEKQQSTVKEATLSQLTAQVRHGKPLIELTCTLKTLLPLHELRQA